MSEKRLRSALCLSKRDPAYWRTRVFKNAYTYKGRWNEVRSWSVKIQLFGKRKSFTLKSEARAEAAAEACQIYQALIQHGWKAVARDRTAAHLESSFKSWPVPSPRSGYYDHDYWKQRLIHRKYPEPSQMEREQELSVRVEHAGTSHYFPLGTSDENEAAGQAMVIHRAVVNHGWLWANSQFPRELSLALRWQDKPLAWTYTTIHTQPCDRPPRPVRSQASSLPVKNVVLVEADCGIRSALAECVSNQEGFRCDASFGSVVEAMRKIARVDLALVSHEFAHGPGVACLEELQQVWPSLAVLPYSVFEDTDQLFKATPGGAMVYLLNRTSPSRIFEPIANLTGPATVEKIASHVRQYFQQLSALLPAGPPSWKLAKLTPREHQILALLSKGDLIKEIAETLNISSWTVHGHMKSIFEKLGVHTRTEAAVKYIQK
jgi:DNA-binding NarL/FixJ family response regulator